jgi:nucleoside-diphosphate-sugar epimerase
MKTVITGGAGFLGSKLSAALLANDASSQIICIDQAAPAKPVPGVTYVQGDICEPGTFDKLMPGDTTSIFHLAAVVSSQAEAEFDLGMKVNLDATRALLERCRKLSAPPRFLFASSVAAFGITPPVVVDDTPARPINSYGVEKVIGEYLVGEYARRRFVDGRCFRLPTIVIRPGVPNMAASSFASSILREPLNGEKAICPVGADLTMWVQSPRAVISNLIHGHDLPADAWQDGLRVLNLPGITVTVAEMVAGLERAGGNSGLISWERDEMIEAIVGSWPSRFDTGRADKLGFSADQSIDEIIENYISEHGKAG